ncbi:MAG: SH3 domain-containing protein [Motiliproteus sp.]
MRKLPLVCMITGIVFSVSSCKTTDIQEQIAGSSAGAVVGGVLGSKLGDGKGRKLSTIVGAAVGAWVGYKLAQYLGEKDRQNLAQSTQQTAVSGRRQVWRNSDTGVSGVTEVKRTKRELKPVQVKVLKGKVLETPPIEFLDKTYIAKRSSNVRGGPGTDYVVVDSLNANEEVTVLGKVIGKNWYLISENGVGSGFVYSSLLLESARKSPARALIAANKTEEVIEVTIASGQTCRIVTQQVQLADGSEQSDEVTVCKGQNGWEMV